MFLALGNHAVEVVEISVHGIDVPVVGNVVSEIDLGRGIARSDPDGVDSEFMQVTHLGADAVEIADAVVIAIGKTARVNFVKYGVLPPLMAFRVDRCDLGSDEKRAEEG